MPMTYPEIIQPAVPKLQSEGRSLINNKNHGPSGSDCGSHFGFKNFQLEDYARGALHDGLVLGHDTGGGKSLALFTWPALKVGFQTEFAPDEPRALRPLGPV